MIDLYRTTLFCHLYEGKLAFYLYEFREIREISIMIFFIATALLLSALSLLSGTIISQIMTHFCLPTYISCTRTFKPIKYVLVT